MTAVELLDPYDASPSNPEWHKLRRAGISASDIAAVLGISPWESPFSLYWRKREGWETEQVDEMKAGTRAEPVIADWFADECDPHENLHLEPAGLYAHETRPWQMATPDRLIHGPLEWDCRECGGQGYHEATEQRPWREICDCCLDHKPDVGPLWALLECKYLVGGWDGWGEPGTDDVPVHYRAQCLWQADVLEVDTVYLAAWHGAEFRCYTIRRDERDLRIMRAAGEEFMRRLAEDDPPNIDEHAATLRTLKALHPDIDDRDQDVSQATADGYTRARRLKAAAERLCDRFEVRLRAEMGDAHRAVYDGRTVATRVISDVAESTVTRAAHRRDYLLAPRKKAS